MASQRWLEVNDLGRLVNRYGRRKIIRFDKMYLEGMFIFGKTFQILTGQFLFNLFLILWIYNSNASSLESGSAETTSVYSR